MALELGNLHHMPTIKVAMTPFPFFVEIDASVTEARAVMREHEIHHLPVTEDGTLVGMLSERELRLLEATGRIDVDAPGSVRDACVRDAYVVDVDAPLDEVLSTMAARHLGAALVVKNRKLAGILTSSDACRLLAEALRERFPAPDGDSAA